MSKKNREKTIEHFINDKGQIKFWPRKRKKQLLILDYLKSQLTVGASYSEREINEVLKTKHLFSDWVLLRRELVDLGYVIRERDGSLYTVSKKVGDNQ
jgi:hypothetical protein